MISQIAQGVFGGGAVGHVLFLLVQAMTMLILVLAANTSFADFPRLASFHADDAFMPKQLTKRGPPARVLERHHRAGDRGRRARRRVPGRCHPPDPALRHRRVHVVHAVAGGDGRPPPHAARAGLAGRACSSTAPARSRRASSTVIIAVTKFTHGAWFIMILVPVHGGRAGAAQPSVRVREGASSSATLAGRDAPDPPAPHRARARRPTSTAARPAPSSTPARSRRTTSAPCTSRPTRSRPRSWSTSGRAWASTAFPSRSSTARTAASPAPCSRSWPRRWPTARPRSASSCRGASTSGSGTGFLHDRTSDSIAGSSPPCPTPT